MNSGIQNDSRRGVFARCAGVAVAVLLAMAGGSAAALDTAVLDSGGVQGVATPGSGVTAFLGIPFAAPPVGALRWRAPQPPAPWQVVRKADRFSSSCVQPELTGTGPWTREFYAKPPFSEDCLYLNVWTPAKAAGEKLPVAVWIHGGGFDQGGADEAIYYGHELARQKVVFVSLNYRMGVFGFYAHPELTRESPDASSGNYAFQDQIAALRWVQRNIAAFGGDPGNVTLIGQSAGASSIEVLLVSAPARGLFRRAISESGFQLRGRAWTRLRDHEQLGVKYAESKGAKSLAEMRALPATELIQVRTAPIRFLPIVDGWVLEDEPDNRIAAGRFQDVPLIHGWNAAEGSVPFDRKLSCEEWSKLIRDTFGAQADALMRLYPAPTGGDCTPASQLAGHDRIVLAAYAWNANRAKSAKAPLYAYEFAHVMPGPSAANWGAFHSAEIVYALRTSDGLLDRPFGPVDARVADQVSGYWVNFVRNGDPNGPGLPKWSPFEPGVNTVMELAAESRPRALAPDARFAFYGQVLQPPK